MNGIIKISFVLAIVTMTYCAATNDFDLVNDVDDFDNGRCQCTREWIPICGTDDQTYANDCEFDCIKESDYGRKLKLEVKHFGRCMEQWA